jgi:hypothetical protein
VTSASEHTRFRQPYPISCYSFLHVTTRHIFDDILHSFFAQLSRHVYLRVLSTLVDIMEFRDRANSRIDLTRLSKHHQSRHPGNLALNVDPSCLCTTTNCLQECRETSMRLLLDSLQLQSVRTANEGHQETTERNLQYSSQTNSDDYQEGSQSSASGYQQSSSHLKAEWNVRALFPIVTKESQNDECPKSVALSYATDWYYHPSTPTFLICSSCYSQQIERTIFASSFLCEYKSEESPRMCTFHVLRIKNILWAQALARRDLTPLLTYMQRRAQLKCPGTSKTHDTSIKYFAHKDGAPVDGFIVCEACYEDVILAKSFAHNFTPYAGVQTTNDYWACDAAQPPVLRAFEDHNDEASWIEAVKKASRIWQVGTCPANRASDTARAQWYRLTNSIEGFVICETCYLNKVVNTPFAIHFEFAAGQWQTGWSCDFSAWSISFAWGAAMMKKDFNLFWDTANTIMHSPFCAASDMSSEIWYSLNPTNKDFNVCPACYEGIFKSYGYGSCLVPRLFAPDEKRPTSCRMWREGKRGTTYIDKYCEAVDTQQFWKFADLVATIASAQVCPRDGKWTNRNWYGYRDALFCDECYRLFVKNTTLAKENKLEFNFEQVAEESFCSIYSPRMREKWLVACSTGDIQPFLEFARHRSSVHARTAPEVARLLQMVQMRQMMSLSMGMMTMMTHTGDSISNMAGNTSQTWDVTTSDGFHGSGGSEIGAQRQADFERSMAQAGGMNEMSRAEFLNQLWKQVE